MNVLKSASLGRFGGGRARNVFRPRKRRQNAMRKVGRNKRMCHSYQISEEHPGRMMIQMVMTKVSDGMKCEVP